MSVSEKVYKALSPYGGSTLNERVYNYLGSLGHTGAYNDRLGGYTYLGYRGYRAILEQFGKGYVESGLTWDNRQTWDNGTYWS